MEIELTINMTGYIMDNYKSSRQRAKNCLTFQVVMGKHVLKCGC
jgi:hypothetical protein